MKWISSTDQLPDDNEEVLVKIGDDCMLAVFNAELRAFYIKKESKWAKTEEAKISWTRLLPPAR